MKIEIQKDLLHSLFTLAYVVEAKDAYTAGHLWRVSQYAKLVGLKLGFNQSELSALMAGAFLHDLGKVAIPDSILNKKSKLEDEEYEVIKTHPQVGVSIIESHPLALLVKQVIEQHHEMPNGKGYPYGLDWDQVSLFSKIVGICDAFDAMTSNRSYRKGFPLAKAMDILKSEDGSQFDSELLKIFFEIPIQDIQHVCGHSDDGIPLLSCPACSAPIQILFNTKDGDEGLCRACSGNFILHKNRDEKTGFSLEFKNMESLASTIYRKEIDDSVVDKLVSSFPKYIEIVG